MKAINDKFKSGYASAFIQWIYPILNYAMLPRYILSIARQQHLRGLSCRSQVLYIGAQEGL